MMFSSSSQNEKLPGQGVHTPIGPKLYPMEQLRQVKGPSQRTQGSAQG